MIVRLRNWVGDVVLSLSSLHHLQSQGYGLVLVGRPWAARLLAGEPWEVHALPKTFHAQVEQLRSLRQACIAVDPTFDRPANTLLLPDSFSSALTARLAGLRALGHAHEGRSLLLSRAIRREKGLHQVQRDWRLATALTGIANLPPSFSVLRVTGAAQAQALTLRLQLGLDGAYVVVCPFAGGTFEGMNKCWPHFPEFSKLAAQRFPTLPQLICPGPGEESAARAHYSHAVVVPAIGLDVYAALIQQSTLMVSNDTGPGHIAAAVGARLMSVLGPTDAAQWGARGPAVTIIQEGDTDAWPTVQTALQTCEALLLKTLG